MGTLEGGHMWKSQRWMVYSQNVHSTRPMMTRGKMNAGVTVTSGEESQCRSVCQLEDTNRWQCVHVHAHFACVYINMHKCVHVCMHACTHTHTYSYTHAHTHTTTLLTRITKKPSKRSCGPGKCTSGLQQQEQAVIFHFPCNPLPYPSFYTSPHSSPSNCFTPLPLH